MKGLIVKLLAEKHNFPSLKQLAFVKRTYADKNGVALEEGRYFMTSLPQNKLSASRFLQYITSHWEVENNLHNVKDKHLNEDKQQTKRNFLGCCQSVLRSLGMNLLQAVSNLGKQKGRSLSAKALKMLAKPIEAVKYLSQF